MTTIHSTMTCIFAMFMMNLAHAAQESPSDWIYDPATYPSNTAVVESIEPFDEPRFYAMNPAEDYEADIDWNATHSFTNTTLRTKEFNKDQLVLAIATVKDNQENVYLMCSTPNEGYWVYDYSTASGANPPHLWDECPCQDANQYEFKSNQWTQKKSKTEAQRREEIRRKRAAAFGGVQTSEGNKRASEETKEAEVEPSKKASHEAENECDTNVSAPASKSRLIQEEEERLNKALIAQMMAEQNRENAERTRNDALLAQNYQEPTHHNHRYNGNGGFGGFGGGGDDLSIALAMSLADQAPKKPSRHNNFWTCNADVECRDWFNGGTETKKCRRSNLMKAYNCKSCGASKPPQ